MLQTKNITISMNVTHIMIFMETNAMIYQPLQYILNKNVMLIELVNITLKMKWNML